MKISNKQVHEMSYDKAYSFQSREAIKKRAVPKDTAWEQTKDKNKARQKRIVWEAM